MKIVPTLAAAILAAGNLCYAAHAATIVVNQHNPINASVVGVIGNNTNAVVTQNGLINGSAVGEVGVKLSATITQTGMHNVSTIVQEP